MVEVGSIAGRNELVDVREWRTGAASADAARERMARYLMMVVYVMIDMIE